VEGNKDFFRRKAGVVQEYGFAFEDIRTDEERRAEPRTKRHIPANWFDRFIYILIEGRETERRAALDLTFRDSARNLALRKEGVVYDREFNENWQKQHEK
jgi:hypothetical protein